MVAKNNISKNSQSLQSLKNFLQLFNVLIGSSSDVTGSYEIQTWGDSLTAGTGGTPYPTQLETISGFTINNGGIGGETSTQIKDRMVADSASYGLPTIIWAGRNNYSSPETVKSDIATMIATLTTSNYIVLSLLNGNYTTEYKDGNGYNTITQLNDDLRDTYGERFVDIRRVLVSNYNRDISQDVTDYNNDIVPNSLRSDNIHLNADGYYLVALEILKGINKLIENSGNIITPSILRYLFANPPIIGSETPSQGFFTSLALKDKLISISGDNSSFQFAGKVIPQSDNVYDLGFSNNSLRWRRVYVSGNYVCKGSDGIDGSFTTLDGKTVTVLGGIITSIA